MNKKVIAAAVFAVFAAVPGAKAAGSMDSLYGTGEKISAIDMQKDSGMAGEVLGNLFSGSLSQKPAVQAEGGASSGPAAKAGDARNIYGQTAKDLCNARPARVRLAAEVKPVSSAIGKAALAGATRYGVSEWVDDFNTVTEYVGHVGSHAVETWDAVNANNGIDPDEVGIVHGVINTVDAIVNP